MKLNLGCGTDIRPGWVNADHVDGPGVDVVMDARRPWPFPDNRFDEVHASHVLEHLENWLDVMMEAHRTLKPNGQLMVRVPYGIGPQNPDPQHERYFWPGSMDIFCLPSKGSPGLDAHKYNGRFVKVQQKVMRQVWYHWHIGRYFGVWFFDRFKYKFPPIGEKREIVWVLRAVKNRDDGTSFQEGES